MVRCSQCEKELELITGHSTIRLFRCKGCGAQQLLPGLGEAAQPGGPAATVAVADLAATASDGAPPIEDPVAAAAQLIAQNPGPGPKIPRAVVFTVIALALGALLVAVL